MVSDWLKTTKILFIFVGSQPETVSIYSKRIKAEVFRFIWYKDCYFEVAASKNTEGNTLTWQQKYQIEKKKKITRYLREIGARYTEFGGDW